VESDEVQVEECRQFPFVPIALVRTVPAYYYHVVGIRGHGVVSPAASAYPSVESREPSTQ